MTTIYTVNNKVLKNSANDKWLIKKAAPAGFVMNASNQVGTSSGNNVTYWNGPNYPDWCDLEGKTIVVTVTEAITTPYSTWRICYASRTDGQEEPISLIASQSVTNRTLMPGTYTYIANRNPAPASSNYGKYISLNSINNSDIGKISIQILDV